MRGLHRGEVTHAVEVSQPDVGEELVEPIGPGPREQRIELGPQHGRRCRDPVVRRWRLFGDGPGDRAGAGPVPADGSRERPRLGVAGDQVVQPFLGDLETGAGLVRPEVPQILAHRVRAAVQEPLGQTELVEGLVPELLLGRRAEDPAADSR